MTLTVLVTCPFCEAELLRYDTIRAPYAEIEHSTRSHLYERHPIRRRLSRRVRKALRA